MLPYWRAIKSIFDVFLKLMYRSVLTADDTVDIVAMTTFTGYGIHSQHMLGNLVQHRKLRSLSANQIGIK